MAVEDCPCKINYVVAVIAPTGLILTNLRNVNNTDTSVVTMIIAT